jgi:hypothetical protein
MSKETTICPRCGEEYQRLAAHFSLGSCDAPEFTAEQKEMSDFLLLKGVTVETTTAKPKVRMSSTYRGDLENVATALGWAANSIRVHESPEDRAARYRREYGHDYTADELKQVWAMSSVPHEYFEGRTTPADVTDLRAGTAQHLVRTAGDWIGGPIGTLRFDVRGFDVSGDHLRRLLRDSGVGRFCKDSKADSTLSERGHWDGDVVCVPHWQAVAFLQRIGMDVGDVLDQLIRGTGE